MHLKNIKRLKNGGILQDISARSPSVEFKKYNLIYGFNGSGKTTLSRILASFETGELADKLPSSVSCDLQLNDDSEVSFVEGQRPFGEKLAVFNKDFIERSFFWDQGKAEAIFYVSRGQSDAARVRSEKSKELERVERELAEKEKTKRASDRAFSAIATEIGTSVNERLQLGRSYNARNVKTDFEVFSPDEYEPISEEQIASYTALIRQASPLPKIERKPKLTTVDAQWIEGCRSILTTTLGELSIQELVEHPSMTDWVKKGADYHAENGLENCLHCGSEIPLGRLDELKAALDQSFSEIKEKLTSWVDELEGVLGAYERLENELPADSSISPQFQSEYSNQKSTLQNQLRRLETDLSSLLKLVRQKGGAINETLDLEGISTPDEFLKNQHSAENALRNLTEIIEQHDAAFDEFSDNQKAAQNSLRMKILSDEYLRYASAKSEAESAEKEVGELTTKTAELKNEISRLSAEIRDRAPAAAAINELLHDYLGHNELKLVPAEGDEGFEIHRHERPIEGPPSDGEITAFALCYFLSSLTADGRDPAEMVIVIDDPISSLDTRAQAYALSLIREKAGECAQLILLTHHLQFMCDARRWLKHYNKKKQKNYAPFFLRVRMNESGQRESVIEDMPKLLLRHDTEYYYLFYVVKKYADQDSVEHPDAFLVPNAIRKLCEIFLAFKFPELDKSDKGTTALIRKANVNWPDFDNVSARALDRVVNTASHGKIDALTSPSVPTVEEGHSAAKALLLLMEHADKDHFDGLVAITSEAEAG